MRKFTSWRGLKKQFKKDCMSAKMKVEFKGLRAYAAQFHRKGILVLFKVHCVCDLMNEKHKSEQHWPNKATRVRRKQVRHDDKNH